MTIAIAQGQLDHVLLDLALLFALCIVVVVGFHRLRVPPIVGFLIAGALMGPHAFGLIKQTELVEQLAEIGVMILLFTVGMELSLRDLLKMRRSLLIGGGLQIGLTIALGSLVALVGGLPWGTAIFLGFVLSLSSTATIAKLLQDRGELGSPSGRLAMSICVAQDFAVVPMLLVLPLLAAGMGDGPGIGLGATLWQVGSSFVFLVLIMGGAWLLVPRVLGLVSRTRSREVFVLTIFTMCLAGAAATASLGLSLALGAFLVGLILSESGYHHQATAEVEPFRDALSSVFFVSIGMLFDFSVILEQPLLVLLALTAVIAGKAVIVWVAARRLSLPNWVGIRAGLLLAQVGEFSFVVIAVARSNELQLGGIESVFVVVAVLSMALTPLMLIVGRRLTRRPAKTGADREREPKNRRRDHVVIVGFGPGGQAVAKALRSQDIPFVVIEMNAETVKKYRARDYSIFLGDSSRDAVLTAAGLPRARLLVLAINDPGATQSTADLARRIAPDCRIVARTNFIGEVSKLRRIGVQEIVPQELETSIEIMVRVLRHYLVPTSEVGRQVRLVRENADLPDRAKRTFEGDTYRLAEFLPGLGLELFRVESGSEIADFALEDSDLRRMSGCTVVALKRDGSTDISIRPSTVVHVGDILVLLGPTRRIGEAAYLFRAPEAEAPDTEPVEDELPLVDDVSVVVDEIPAAVDESDGQQVN